ncbi:hypothetical protein L3Q82_017722, partial [Scortum barcoo]
SLPSDRADPVWPVCAGLFATWGARSRSENGPPSVSRRPVEPAGTGVVGARPLRLFPSSSSSLPVLPGPLRHGSLRGGAGTARGAPTAAPVERDGGRLAPDHARLLPRHVTCGAAARLPVLPQRLPDADRLELLRMLCWSHLRSLTQPESDHIPGFDDRDTDLFLCDTNTCKFDGECLRIGNMVTCICDFKWLSNHSLATVIAQSPWMHNHRLSRTKNPKDETCKGLCEEEDSLSLFLEPPHYPTPVAARVTNAAPDINHMTTGLADGKKEAASSATQRNLGRERLSLVMSHRWLWIHSGDGGFKSPILSSLLSFPWGKSEPNAGEDQEMGWGSFHGKEGTLKRHPQASAGQLSLPLHHAWHKCNNDYAPVCGSNNQNYQNECFLRRDACKQQSEVLIMSEGACPAGMYIYIMFMRPRRYEDYNQKMSSQESEASIRGSVSKNRAPRIVHFENKPPRVPFSYYWIRLEISGLVVTMMLAQDQEMMRCEIGPRRLVARLDVAREALTQLGTLSMDSSTAVQSVPVVVVPGCSWTQTGRILDKQDPRSIPESNEGNNTLLSAFAHAHTGGEGSAEAGQKETSTCDICQFGAECDVDAEDVWCVCNIDCSHISFNPVCASDGHSYDNPCQVKEASCQKQERIEVKYLGHCQGDIITGKKPGDSHFARTDLTVEEKDDQSNELARGLYIPCPDHYKNYSCVHGECQFPSMLAQPSCSCHSGFRGPQCDIKEYNVLYVVPGSGKLHYVLIASIIGALQVVIICVVVLCITSRHLVAKDNTEEGATIFFTMVEINDDKNHRLCEGGKQDWIR